jgi:hypothetical protein
MKLGCTSHTTTNVPVSRGSFILALLGQMDMLVIQAMVAILRMVDILCITILLAMR